MLETLLAALFVLQQSYWTTQTLAACLIFFKESRVVAFALHKKTVKLKRLRNWNKTAPKESETES